MCLRNIHLVRLHGNNIIIFTYINNIALSERTYSRARVLRKGVEPTFLFHLSSLVMNVGSKTVLRLSLF